MVVDTLTTFVMIMRHALLLIKIIFIYQMFYKLVPLLLKFFYYLAEIFIEFY